MASCAGGGHLARRVHFYVIALFHGLALCMLMLLLPDIAVQAFENEPNTCVLAPRGSDCMAARSKASWVLGLSNGAKALVALVLGPILGAISDVHGRRFFWLGAGVGLQLSFVALLLHVLGYTSIWPFLVLNSLSGLLLPAQLAVVSDEYEREFRAMAFGRLIAALDVSVLAGPLLSSKLTLSSAAVLVCASGAVGLLLAALYGESLPPEQRLRPDDGVAHWRPDVALGILRSTPLFRRLSIVIVASTLPIAGLQQCFLLFLEAAYGLDRAGAAGLFVALATSGLAVQVFVLPVLMPRVTITKALILGLGLQLLQGAVLAFVHSTVAVLVACVLSGFGSIVFPCVCALKANAAPEQEQGRVQGAVSSLQSAALGVGPVVYGALFAYLAGPSAPGGEPLPAATFVLSIVVLAVALALSFTLHRHVPDDLKNPQTPVPRRNVSLSMLRRGSSVDRRGLNPDASAF